MSLTITPDTDPLTGASSRVEGDQRVSQGTITFDSSYPTGGEDYSALFERFGFEVKIDRLEVAALNTAASRFIVNDHANKKVKVFTALSTEAANASDQSTIAVRYTAWGD